MLVTSSIVSFVLQRLLPEAVACLSLFTLPLDVLSDAADCCEAVCSLIHHQLGGCALRQDSAQVHDASVLPQTGCRPANTAGSPWQDAATSLMGLCYLDYPDSEKCNEGAWSGCPCG